jgi:hypothetical protein
MGGAGWAAWVVIAATWYVDGNAADCSTGPTEPFCTLQEAFDNPALAPGDEILLRDAATPYGGGEVAGIDGSAAAPIVLRPDDGHAPIVGGRIQLSSSSHWIVRGLTFDGGGTEPGHTAISATTGDEVITGVVIENNTIVDWGGPLITIPEDGTSAAVIAVSSYPSIADSALVDPIVRNNRILDSRGKGIAVVNANGATVEANEVAQMRCQMETNGPGMSGVYLYNVEAGTVARNRIHDFDATPCTLDGELRVVGVWIHDAELAEIHHNLVERMGGQNGVGMGIDLIQSADDCTVHHNVILDADQCGLCNGVLASGGGDGARFVANTVIGGRRFAIDLAAGENAEFVDNVAVGAGVAQVRLLRTAEITFEGGVSTWTFENNLYFPAQGEDNVARFEYDSSVGFDAWTSGCACDSSSIVADPMLPPPGTENFTAAAESPVVDRGIEVPESELWNGAGIDLGAVEAPIVIGASIAAAEPDRIRVDLESETSALRHDPGCAGVVPTIDGEPVAAVACELDGDAGILVRLAEPAHAGDVVMLAYSGSSISNSDAIGGVVHGLLQPFAIEVDNGSEATPPADTGDEDGATDDGASTTEATTGATTSGSQTGPGSVEGTATDTDSGGADYPGVDGCSCHSRPSAWPTWALLLLVALRRRTIA